MTTLTRLIRTFDHKEIHKDANGNPVYELTKRDRILPSLEPEIIPCLNCMEPKVRKAHGQIVRFCSKECKKSFNRRNK